MQTKLAVNAAGDTHEQEADRIADEVMRKPDKRLPIHRTAVRSEGPPGWRALQASPGHERLPATRVGAADTWDSDSAPLVNEVVRSPGRRLDSAVRGFFERRFGRDFSHVRVHTDAKAAESARAVNALAYTAGQHIVFGAQQFEPTTEKGKRLLAHELVHTVQNHGRQGLPAIRRKAPKGEEDARKFVDGVMWVMSESIRQYRRDEHIKQPKRHPNTLRQDLEVMRRWLLWARRRIRAELGGDPKLQNKLRRVYRIYVYTAIEGFARKLKRPAWKLYREHKDAIHKLAGPPPKRRKKRREARLNRMDTLVLPRLREARCGMINQNVEYCGNVIETADGNLRVTGPVTIGEVARCQERTPLHPGERHVAYYHSHPRDLSRTFALADPNLRFTEFDMNTADREGIIFYLVNWRSEVLKYYPRVSESAIHGRTVKLTTFRNLSCTD